MGLINEKLPLTADQRRLQSAQDDLMGAMEMGAHSSVIKGFQEIRKTVLDEIREENRDVRERALLEHAALTQLPGFALEEDALVPVRGSESHRGVVRGGPVTVFRDGHAG